VVLIPRILLKVKNMNTTKTYPEYVHKFLCQVFSFSLFFFQARFEIPMECNLTIKIINIK